MPHIRKAGLTKIFMLFVLVMLLVAAGGIIYYGFVYDTPMVPLSSFPVEGIRIVNHLNGTTIKGLVYVASSTQQQVQGFQNVTTFGNCNGFSTNLSTRCLGMIFVTSYTQNLCFWMRNTPLALQQVWISANGTVVYIFEAQPESLKTVCQSGVDVLETSPTLPISVGDRIILEGTFFHS
jgi:uncharacterized membrane protein (UPF0127 family)